MSNFHKTNTCIDIKTVNEYCPLYHWLCLGYTGTSNFITNPTKITKRLGKSNQYLCLPPREPVSTEEVAVFVVWGPAARASAQGEFGSSVAEGAVPGGITIARVVTAAKGWGIIGPRVGLRHWGEKKKYLLFLWIFLWISMLTVRCWISFRVFNDLNLGA